MSRPGQSLTGILKRIKRNAGRSKIGALKAFIDYRPSDVELERMKAKVRALLTGQ